MGSFVLKINSRILINTLQSAVNKKGGFYQCCRARHVFSYKTNYCALQQFRNSNYKKNILVRLASTNVNLTETTAQVSSISNVPTISSTIPEVQLDSIFFKPEVVSEDSALPFATFPLDSEPSAAISNAVSELANSGIEPTLKSLGLANSSWPSGWLQSLLEYIHVTYDVPWWGAIAIVTVTLRLATFPIIVYFRKYMVKMNNLSPQTQEFFVKINEARKAKNYEEVHRLNYELINFHEKHNISPYKPLIPMWIQAFMFISFYSALNGMTKLPVESMKTGGLFWFTDLTIPDQYYLLPFITSGTLFLMMVLGPKTQEFGDLPFKHGKTVMYMLPFALVFFTIHFPSAVLCYWTTNNAFTFGQNLLLENKKVQQAFGIPEKIVHEKKNLLFSNLNIFDFKQTVDDAKKASAMSDGEKLLKKHPLPPKTIFKMISKMSKK